ncbi:glycosyltransferase [Isoptericola rhizosphaerae]|uniref:glycosyltransferase n=1 Tax=Isoptericola rhizosphaerae TaxID=3377837 RepID=UPI00383B8C82
MTTQSCQKFVLDAAVARTAADRFARAGIRAGQRAATTALDMQSESAREVMARMIDPDADYTAIIADALEPAMTASAGDDTSKARVLCSLGRTVGLQRFHEDDVTHALAFFRRARQDLSASRWSPSELKTYAQLLWIEGHYETLRGDSELLAALPAPWPEFLQIELAGVEHGVGSVPWLDLLNAHLVGEGVAPVTLATTSAPPFDRLGPSTSRAAGPGPLISVVMPAFRPGPESITAVRSIVEQTWQDWELLVVDDASGAEYDEVFAQIAYMDPRVRVIRQPVNRGTYAVRNRALEEARGEFVTFQDIDDWSHPERLERQVIPLQNDPSLVRTLSRSLRCSDGLVFQYLGYSPDRENASSHMFRRSVLETVGRFDWVRKGADSEFDQRLEAVFPGRRLQMTEPLAFVRLEPDSLSRGDFRPGWTHPARVEYRDAMRHWHEQIKVGASPEIPVDVARRPLTAPRPFLRDLEVPDQHVDLAVAADWSMDGATQRAALEEIQALTRSGRRVGLVHLRSMFGDATPRAALSIAARRALADRSAMFVSLEEADHVPTIVVRQPEILEFPSSRPVALTTDQVVIVADSLPGPESGAEPRWTVADCDNNAQALFGLVPRWAAQDDMVEAAVARHIGDRPVQRHPAVLDVLAWSTPRTRFRADRPVIGWICGTDPAALPASLPLLQEIYPDDGSVDVRILGGRQHLRAALGSVPPAWLVYGAGEISARELMMQLDFAVAFPPEGPTLDTLRTMHEALAAGCVVVTDQSISPHLGDAAVYCEPADALALVTDLRHRPDAYREQSQKGRRWVEERFANSAEGFAEICS